jgi:hypothetical protein
MMLLAHSSEPDTYQPALNRQLMPPGEGIPQLGGRQAFRQAFRNAGGFPRMPGAFGPRLLKRYGAAAVAHSAP